MSDAGLLAGPCCAAPAGDGGLREALEKLAVEWGDEPSTASRQWLARDLRALLAAHPAAPAVPPQPAEHAVCNACGWEGDAAHDLCPACGQDEVNYFTPASESAVPQPAEVEYEDEELETEADVERRNHWFRLAVELGQQDEFVEMLAHERRLPATRAGRDAAIPQPVDREALIQVVAEYIDDLDNVPAMGSPADHLERRAVHVADAVLAVLAGEQEQVEP